MNNFTGRLYRKTALRNGDRRAGIGAAEDDYGDESFPRARSPRPELARMPHDGEKPEDLNGTCIIVKPGKPKTAKLKAVSYEESRITFFREQRRVATRRLDYAVRNRYPETVCAERGDAVSFYTDVIKMLEEKTANEAIWHRQPPTAACHVLAFVRFNGYADDFPDQLATLRYTPKDGWLKNGQPIDPEIATVTCWVPMPEAGKDD